MQKLQKIKDIKDIVDNKLTRPQRLGLMSFFQFVSDLSMAYTLYYLFLYSGATFFFGQDFNGPNFQEQFFKLMLMGLKFFLLFFLGTQFILYLYLNITYSKTTVLYFKIYAVFGFAVAFYTTFFLSSYCILNMLFYLAGYYIFAREFKLIKEQGQMPSLLARLLPKKS